MNWLKPICLSFFKTTRLKHALTKHKKVTPPFSLETLEPKILLSAELVGGMIDGSSFTTEQSDEHFTSQVELDQWTSQFVNQVTSNTSSEEPSVDSPSSNLALDGLATFFADQQAQHNSDDLGQLLADAAVTASQINEQPLELIIVDPRTPDYLQLMEGISTDSGSDYLVYMLDAEEDGVQQITDLLTTHSELDAVHLISHGNEGGIQLGSAWLSTDNLDQYSEQIGAWQSVFDEDADILIYGCDLAGNLSGEQLINSLAELTGADVAASNDTTGATELGGNWELEYQTGEINTQIAFTQDAQGTWQHVLATSGELWLTTNGTANSEAGGGVNHDILSFSDPSLTLESGDGSSGETDGTFYTENNTLPADLMAMHYVSTAVTVDTFVDGVSGTYDLQVGQIVVSIINPDSGNPDKSVPTVNSGTINVNNTDLLVFTPSTYTFEFLLEDAIFESDDVTAANIHAVSIVEKDTVIGDGTVLTAGTYLLARSDAAVHADISTYTDAAGLQKLLSGSEYLSDPDKQIQGLELVESGMVVGGQTVSAGTILITVNDPVTVGSSGGTTVAAQQIDIVALTVNQSEQDGTPNTDVDAQILFDGSDINLYISSDGEINGLSLFSTSPNNVPEATNLFQTLNYIEGTAVVALDDIVITDQDTSDIVTATLTLTNTAAGSLTTGTFGVAISSYNSSTGVWTVSGSVSDVNAALAAVSFSPVSQTTTDQVTITTHIEDAEASAPTDGTITLNALAQGNALWLTTDDDVSDSGVPSLNDWTAGEVLEVSDPNLSFDTDSSPSATTDGTVSSVIDFDAFNPASVGGNNDVQVNALHYVSVDITIGTDVDNHYDLKQGDILFSVDNVEKLKSTNTLTVDKNDLVVFRPDVLNDYSKGEFSILINGLASKKLYAVTLVEQETVVAGVTLNAGDFLFSQEEDSIHLVGLNTVDDDKIYRAVITGTGNPLAGTVGKIGTFIDGDDVGIEEKIYGLELIEKTTVIAGTTLNAGNILITIGDDDDEEVGDNELTVTDNDIFILDATSPTNASATLLFDGSDLSFSGDINGLTLITNSPATATNMTSTVSYDEDAISVDLDDIVVTDSNLNDVITAKLTLVDINAGSLSTGTFGSATSLYDSASGFWTVSGSVSDVNAALAAVTFTPVANYELNTSIITHIEDSASTGPVDGIISLNVNPQNDLPTATNLTQVHNYNEGDSSIALDAIVVTDIDANETVTASLTLANVAAGALTTGTFGTSSSSYNGITGVWTITGSVTNVNAALAVVKFTPATNNDLDTTISTHIEDAASTGPSDGIINLNVTADNDAPSATNLTQVKNYNEGDASVALDDIVITELDSNETVTASLTLANVTAGVLTTGTFGAATSSYNSSTGVWSVTGTVSNVNAALAAVAFTPATNNDLDTTISTHIEDAASTGPSDGIINLNVTADNDAPSATNLTQVKNYNEGDASVALDDIVITELDSNETVTASLTLANVTAGVLTTGTFGAATSSYNSSTGVWSVTGTVSNVNAALAAVAFTPATNNDLDTTISTHIEDAASTGPSDGIINLNVTADNDAPSATNLTQVKNYNEGDASVALDDIVITELDSNETVTASLTLANVTAGVLTTGTFGAATSSYNSSTGVWSVTGTVSNINAALAAVAFTPATNNDLDTTITTHIQDAANTGPIDGSISLNVTAENDAPTATNLTQVKNYTEGAASVALDAIVITEFDSNEIVTASLTLADVATGTLTTGTFGDSTSNYNSTTGVWTVTGSVANVNAALAAVAFTPNTNNDINTTITTHIQDAANTGPIDGSISLNVTAENDAPTATNLTQVKNYTEGAASIALDDIVITEFDSNEIVTASLTLADVATGTITTGTFGDSTSSYSSSTGVWTITGSVANVNAALAAVAFTPNTNNDINTTITTHIQDVANTGPIDGLIILTVAPENDDPTLESSIPDQSASEDTLFNFILPEHSFKDIDNADTITYSAQLLGGGTLPSWLNFNAITGTFSGIPLNQDVGTISIEVIADDGNGGIPASDSFELVIANSNDDPTLEHDINDQTATEDSLFTFTFAANTFSDIDSGDNISYSTQLVGGALIPAWLNFDSNTRTFSGTPTNDDIGTLSIEVIANDNNGGIAATDSFNLIISNSNDLPNGTATITGSVIENQILTANTSTLADDDGLGSFNYQWLRDGVAISGATTSSYMLDDADVGSVISYQVSYTDAQGTLETITSEQTIAVTNINDLPTGTISITGTTTVGNILTVNNDLLDQDGLGVINYQWQRNGIDIVGATENTYTITVSDDNQTLKVVASYTDLHGTSEVVASETTATVTGSNYIPTGSVFINGTPKQGETLNADTSALNDPDGLGTFSYQWQRNGINISGANSASYTLGNNDVDKAITVVISYLDNGLPVGTTESVVSVATTAVVNINDAANATEMNQVQNYTEGDINVALNDIVVSDVDSGDIITASLTLADPSAGELTSGTFATVTSSYHSVTGVWTVTGTVNDVNAALAATAFVPSSDYDIDTYITTHIEDASGAGPVDGVISLQVTAVNDDPTLAHLIADQVSTEKSAFNFMFAANTFNDLDSGASLIYSAQLLGGGALPDWLAFDSATRTFSGTPLNNDVGSINITVSANDGQGGVVASDSFTLTTSNVNDTPLGNVTIIGATLEGDVLSADTSTISDQDGLGVFSYQWLRDGLNISAETNETYTLSGADVGSKISVVVSFKDAQGTTEILTSAETSEIINMNDVPSATNQTQVKNYIEGDSIVSFDNIVVTDVDNAETITATLVLSDTTSGSLSTGVFGSASSSYNSTSGIWTINGSVTDVNAALANVEFLPTANNDRDVYITTHIEDALGAGPSDGVIHLLVSAVNDDPTLVHFIADQVATEDSAFNLTFAANTFEDVDSSDSLTYSTQLTNGSALPAWLSFDAATRTFTGTPLNADVGSLTIEVTADDGKGGLNAVDSFEFVIVNSNDDPILNNAIADQTATEDTVFNFTFAANTFGDVDSGDSLTYSAQLTNGSALPVWLSFDNATRTFTGTPLNADVGSLTIEVIANDGNGGLNAVDSFELVIANSNDDPILNNAIADQTATEDAVFNFTFAANTFGDVDSGDSLTYSAQLTNGSALPSWLSFDTFTRTFTGTPLNSDVGTINIEVTANDGQGGIPATDSFELVITNTNDDPTLDSATADQSATEDSAFNFTLAANTFGDVDSGDSLTYSAQLVGNIPLPTWLSFDANTRTFTGIPLNSDVGTINIEVTANDGQGGIPATDSFELVITNTNDDPTLDSATADQSATEDNAFNFTLAANTFGDVDSGDSLTYSAQLVGNIPLPTWLSFDTNTRTFTGTPLNSDVGTINIEVTANDGQGGIPATDSFELVITNTNDDPTLDSATADQSAMEDAVFNFTFAADTFEDVDSGESLTYSAQLTNGSTLPAWLSFDAATRTFSGTPLNADVGSLTIEVTADDGNGSLKATDSFNLLVTNVNDPALGKVVVTGTLSDGEILVVDTSLISDDDGLGEFTFQWLKNGNEITAATTSSYVLQPTDIGTNISVIVSYIDSQGTLESISSQPQKVSSVDIEMTETTEVTEIIEERVSVVNTPIFIPLDSVELEQEVLDLETMLEEEVEEALQEEIEESAEESLGGGEPEQINNFEQDAFQDQQQVINTAVTSFNSDGEQQVSNNNVNTATVLKILQKNTIEEQQSQLQNDIDNFLMKDDPLMLIQTNNFISGLDEMRQELDQDIVFNKTTVGSTLAVSAGVSAGYVAWLARSGVLLGSVMGTLPVWRFVDPLPVLNQARGVLGEEGESLESIVSDGSDASEENK
ncbi:putative Ig domain-containing protein [Vibrio sp. 2-Bac 85]